MTDDAVAHLDAIRLARELAADDAAAKPIVDELLERAPRGNDSEDRAALLFLQAVAERDIRFGSYTRYRPWPPDRTSSIVAIAIIVAAVYLLWRPF